MTETQITTAHDMRPMADLNEADISKSATFAHMEKAKFNKPVTDEIPPDHPFARTITSIAQSTN